MQAILGGQLSLSWGTGLSLSRYLVFLLNNTAFEVGHAQFCSYVFVMPEISVYNADMDLECHESYYLKVYILFSLAKTESLYTNRVIARIREDKFSSSALYEFICCIRQGIDR